MYLHLGADCVVKSTEMWESSACWIKKPIFMIILSSLTSVMAKIGLST